MNEIAALKLIDNYYTKGEIIEIIGKYCILHKGKDALITYKMIQWLLFNNMPILSELLECVIDLLVKEFNIISIHHEDGTYLNSYINNKNNQNNGTKEIYKI